MKHFTSLLLPLDGSPEAAKGAGCALWLAERLGATLHVLHAASQPFPRCEALGRLRVPNAQQPQVILHQLPEKADAAVLEAIGTHGVNLVVMSARGESSVAGLKPSAHLGAIAQAVIKRSPVPVLVLPVRYREALPWRSMLAAASGQPAAGQALEAATQLAAALRLRVTVVHAEDGPDGAASMPLGTYADAAYHEYPYRIEEMVERGLSTCTPDERCCVEQALLRRGEPATVLLEQARRRQVSVLALGCHGEFGPKRARVLKRLLDEAECALLLVHESERSSARLKVGEELDD